jgi:hypothetical protein
MTRKLRSSCRPTSSGKTTVASERVAIQSVSKGPTTGNILLTRSTEVLHVASETLGQRAPSSTPGSDAATACAVAAIAYAGTDLVHELLGHGVAAWLLGIPVVRLSSVATQTHGASRLVAAAGPLTNLIIGALALVAFSRGRAWTAGRWFLWLFAAVNLMGVLDLATSAVLNSGDSAAAIRGLQPAWAWRTGVAIVGAVAYVAVVRTAARALATLVRSQLLSGRERNLPCSVHRRRSTIMAQPVRPAPDEVEK